jgi:multisubunit Na+/H+ antiporter MnhB subunit
MRKLRKSAVTVLLASGLLVSLFLMPSAASDIYSALLVGGIGVLLLLTIYYRRMERPSAPTASPVWVSILLGVLILFFLLCFLGLGIIFFARD